MYQPTATTHPLTTTTIGKDDASKSSQLKFPNNDVAGGERAANSGQKDDFADSTTINDSGSAQPSGSLKRSGQSQSDVRDLQKEFFELSRENELLKEMLEKIQRESAPKRSKNNSSGGDTGKIEEIMKDLHLEQQLPTDSPQIAPLSDCDDTSNEQEVPRTIDIDISDRSGGSCTTLHLSNRSDDRENTMEEQPKKQKQFNYCRTEDEGEIDYFQIYS